MGTPVSNTTDNRLFILWDRQRDGECRYPDEATDGIIGRVTVDNCYLTAYANYPGEKRPADLDVGECIKSVRYSLSGSHGEYDLIRVR